MQQVQKIIVQYQTVQSPPPYSFEYQMVISLAETGMEVDFKLFYTDRDELTEEEITDEGFTMQDDYSWSGVLPVIWNQEILSMHKKEKWQKEPHSKAENYLEMSFDESGEVVFPQDQEAWEYFLQEIIQAIYEVSGKEMSLFISYWDMLEQAKLKIDLQVLFAERKALVDIDQDGKRTQKEINWATLKDLLQWVYTADFLYEKAETKQPKLYGKYLNTGEGYWFNFGKSLKNPSRSSDVLATIEKKFKALV
jgi:hypothetical protein